MSYNWTKKYQAITLSDLRKMIEKDLQKQKNKTILYFKYIIKTDYGVYERRSNNLQKALKDKK